MKEAALNRISEVFEVAVKKQAIAGANALIYQDGKERYYNEVGHADIAADIPIKRDTIFRIYSMTKPITGAAVMLLCERGILDLQDTVSEYLPGFVGQHVSALAGQAPVKRDVTISDLLGMTAGMPYPDDFNMIPEDQKPVAVREVGAIFEELDAGLETSGGKVGTVELANMLGKCSLQFHPGEGWVYGTCADIAGAVVEVVSGKRYGEFLRDEFFAPLGMNDTAFYVPAEKQCRLARTYEETASGLVEYKGPRIGVQNRMKFPPAFESGGGGLASTIDDYMKFLRMLLGMGTLGEKRILSNATVAYFTSARISPELQSIKDALCGGASGYSNGNLLSILTEPDYAPFFGAKGEYSGAGWLGTCFFCDPKNDLAFLYMTQSIRSSRMDYVRRARNILYTTL